MTEPLAKSIAQGGTTLAEHTAHVAAAVRVLGKALLPDLTEDQLTLAVRGAVLHDLGKAHPFFQDSLKPGFDRRRAEEFRVPHRHELSSLLFLPLFPQAEWPILIDMVVAHHKSLLREDASSTKRGRGLIDLVDHYGEEDVFQRHAEEWDVWHPSVFPILEAHGISTRTVSLSESREAFVNALEHCEQPRKGRNRWRGLLMSADHFASALQEETEGRAARLFTPPDLSPFEDRAAKASADLYPLAKVSTEDPRPHTLLVAPTGAGKTDLLLRRCRSRGRVFYLLPFQASINAMYLRFQALLNGTGADEKVPEERTDIRRVHAASRIEIDGDSEEEQAMQRHPGAAIKVMTPHQIAAIVLGTSGHEAAALDVAGQDVILDEVHVYDERTQALLLAIVDSLTRLGARVHVGSATIPAALAEQIRKRLDGPNSLYEVRLPEEALRTYDRHVVHRLEDEDAARAQVLEALDRGERVLFIANRVDRAQERYLWAQDALEDVPLLLVHSRYRRCDRAAREQQIEVFDNLPGPCLVCATQVVEVSLDISFDTLVTDAAPLDSLVQRFGRVNRRRVRDRGVRPVYVITPPADPKAALPYDTDLLRRSWAALPDGELLEETTLQTRIDAVYPTVNLPAIDEHLAEFEGRFRLRELCHRPRSLLLEMLEIESACCVRESDRDAYVNGRGDARLLLEIPVPWKTARYRLRDMKQIENVGNSPFIVPDSWYDPELGLTLRNEDSTPLCSQFL